MRLLLINPNTTESITEKVLVTARATALQSTTIKAVTGRFGAAYISTRAASAIASHAAIEAYAEHGDDMDAVVLACFGDPGLAGLKELSPVPVLGLAEASCLLAVTVGATFGIVTGGVRWGPMLTEFVASLGLRDKLAGIRTVVPSGAEIADNPDKALGELAAACRALVEQDGAEVVILGGAGLAGLAGRLKGDVPVPLIDSVAAGIVMIEGLARLGLAKPLVGSHTTTDPVPTVGLSARLAERMEKNRLKN